MTAKPVVPRALANRDIDETINYYLDENAESAALDFIDALEQAYAHISLHPATGSPRFAHELNLAELQSWRLTGVPYQVFYVEQPDHIDVWRVLHGQRDIPVWIQHPNNL